jgi:hypothetical protein
LGAAGNVDDVGATVVDVVVVDVVVVDVGG